MKYPLVSIICLCYNHERFLAEALNSVLAQTYPNLEIIIADDASTDNSLAIIKYYCKRYPQIKFIQGIENKGNCRAFNQAFALSTGEYIVDFATDDVLLPERIADQMACFAQLDSTYGVVYTDALLIDEHSNPIRHLYKVLPDGKLKPEPVSGWVYEDLVKRFFVSAPTMLIRRTVLEKLGGYNEALAYEDYDFWVRSGRHYQYYFLNKVLTKRRIHPHQLSARAYKKNDKQLASTVQVCYHVLTLNKTKTEDQALARRVKYELRKALITRNFTEADQLMGILHHLKAVHGQFIWIDLFLKGYKYLFGLGKFKFKPAG